MMSISGKLFLYLSEEAHVSGKAPIHTINFNVVIDNPTRTGVIKALIAKCQSSENHIDGICFEHAVVVDDLPVECDLHQDN